MTRVRPVTRSQSDFFETWMYTVTLIVEDTSSLLEVDAVDFAVILKKLLLMLLPGSFVQCLNPFHNKLDPHGGVP